MYKTGDRIVANSDILGCSHLASDFLIPKGAEGTVLEYGTSCPFVRWDISVFGMHDAGGLCEDGHGYAEFEEYFDSLA